MVQVAEAFVRVRYDTDAASRASLDRTVKRDLGSVERQLQSTNREMSRFSRGALVGTGALGSLGRAAAFASLSFIGGAGLVVGIKSTIDAAEEAEVAQTQLANALDKSGISLKENAALIERRTQAISQMAGIDDELVSRVFTNFVRLNGDVNESLRESSIAADVARGRNISYEASAKLVQRAALGQAGALRRVGIAARDGASATELLDLLQRKYAGSAEAFGNTAAGAQERFSVALENTQEIIGTALLPTVTRYLNKLTDWLNDTDNQARLQRAVNKAVEDATGIVEGLAGAYGGLKGAWDKLPDFGKDKGLKDLLSFGRSHALDDTISQMEDLAAAAKKVAAGYESIDEARSGAGATLTGRVPRTFALPRPKGTGFVGRPLTAAEQFAIQLAGDPDNPNLLREQREKYQRDLDYALKHADDATANTKAFADKIETRTGQIRDITEHLATIAAQNAADAQTAREKMIEALIPNAAGGSGSAGGAFGRFQAAVAGQLGAASGGGPASLDDLQGILGKITTAAELRLQIAEQRVTSEEQLLPYLERLRDAERQALQIIKKTGGTAEDRLRAELALETTKNRIRGINKKDANDGFTLAELFSEATDEFSRYGSNIGSNIDSGREQFKAVVRAHQTVVVQNFHYPMQASQALNDAHAGAINLKSS